MYQQANNSYSKVNKQKSFCTTLIILFSFSLINTISAQSVNNKVVMISIDGAPDYLIDKFLKDGTLPKNGAFARMKKFGASAERVLPVNVASTGPSHISIFTGASPGKTGIVGNSFRNTANNWDSKSLTAFQQPVAAETIFQAAMRQGKKVIALGGVGLDNTEPSRRTDLFHMYPVITGPSLVLNLIKTDTLISDKNDKNYRKLSLELNSPSPSVFEIYGKFKLPLYFYASDSMLNDANKIIPMTQIIVDTDEHIGNGYQISVVPEKWAGTSIKRDNKQYNTSFTILNEDRKAGKYQVLMTAPAEVFGYPESFIEKLQTINGYWPGEPENKKETSGLITEQIWFEQVDRLAAYSKNLILTSMKEEQWDLLFGYFSTLDDVQHRYTLTDPAQLDYKADNGKRPALYQQYIKKYFQRIDSYLLEIMNAASKQTNIVVFSDHGMIPIHSTLLLNNYFETEGFLASKKELISISSGTSAHIYINKEIINNNRYASYLENLTQKLNTLKDPSTGATIFELVADQQKQAKLGLFNPNYSGDLFVSCKPGYSLSDRLLPEVNYLVKNSFDPKMFADQNNATRNFLLNGTMNETGRGVHGSLSKIRKAQSILYAFGPDVPHKNLKKISALQIAPTIAQLLTIQAPSNAEMKSTLK